MFPPHPFLRPTPTPLPAQLSSCAVESAPLDEPRCAAFPWARARRRRTFRTWSSVQAFLPSFVSTVICQRGHAPQHACAKMSRAHRGLRGALVTTHSSRHRRPFAQNEWERDAPTSMAQLKANRAQNGTRAEGQVAWGVHRRASWSIAPQHAGPSATRQVRAGTIGRVMWIGPRACGRFACFPSSCATVPSTKTEPSACAGSLTQTR